MVTDICRMLDLFERLTIVGTARIRLPKSLRSGRRYQALRNYAQETEGIMMGTTLRKCDAKMQWINAMDEEDRKEKNLPDDYLEHAEESLKIITAKMAEVKLENHQQPVLISGCILLSRVIQPIVAPPTQLTVAAPSHLTAVLPFSTGSSSSSPLDLRPFPVQN